MTTISERNFETSDIARLVRRAAQGDRHAWERLVDQYARLIWSITGEFRLVESDAADVAQTTWLRLLEHIDRIEYPDRIGSWLAATARNECLRNLAARKRVVLEGCSHIVPCEGLLVAPKPLNPDTATQLVLAKSAQRGARVADECAADLQHAVLVRQPLGDAGSGGGFRNGFFVRAHN